MPNLEIERKFIIRIPDPLPARKADIEQTYLAGENGGERVRKMTDADGVRRFHTVKKRIDALTAEETENEIGRAEYERLLARRDPARRTIRKTRYYLPHGGLMFEIDVYPFWKRQCVMEVELEREDQAVDVPPDIEIVREVTGELAYQNAALARCVPEEILP